jgi:hypothetical protein
MTKEEIDCISREQAKASIRDKFKDLPSRVEINTILNELPSVTLQESKWIPCSERLPEVGERVLCQCQANIYEVLKLTVDGWYHDNKHCYMSGFVIAWMPLPDQYKVEGRE